MPSFLTLEGNLQSSAEIKRAWQSPTLNWEHLLCVLLPLTLARRWERGSDATCTDPSGQSPELEPGL